MNKKQLIKANQIKRELNIHPDSRIHTGCVRIHPTESLKHFMAKCKDCWEAYQLKEAFLTEAWTMDRKRRFDFVNLATGEIREYETDSKVNKKGAVTKFVG